MSQPKQSDLMVITPPSSLSAITPMRLLEIATQQGADVEKLGKLMELQLAWEANEARKAFVAALNAFKANPPSISKNKDVLHNGVFKYRHATLDNVSGIIGAGLAAVGISHRWETEQRECGVIKVTCILTHSQGHSERVPLEATPDTSGSKNDIQAVGSTVTYLQRYTLLAATGMAVKDQDDDGAGGRKEMAESMKADWHAAIEDLETLEAADALWKRVVTSCTAIGDVAAYDELKGAFAKKRRALGPKP